GCGLLGGLRLTVWDVDPDRVRRGQMVPLDCTVVLRDADKGTFTVTVPDDDLAGRVRDGWRVVIQEGDATVLSGPVEEVAPDLADRSVTFTGVSDLVHLDDKLVLPAPGRAPGAQDRKSTRLNSSHVSISYAVL